MDCLEGSTWKAMVGSSIGDLVHFSTELSGVPGLSLAAKLIEEIAMLAYNVPRNRNQARALYEECERLFDVIKRASEGVDQTPGSSIGKLLSEFVHLLREIQSSMVQWKGFGFWKSFAHQDQIAKSISMYGRKLSSMKDTFNIGALAGIGFEAEIQTFARRRGGNPMPESQVISQASGFDLGEGRYEESERQDRRDAVLAFARLDIDSYLNKMEGSDDREEADDVRQALGQVSEDLDRNELEPVELEHFEQNVHSIHEALPSAHGGGQRPCVTMTQLHTDPNDPSS